MPSFYDVTWIWTLNVSMGWIRHVAIAPEIPPIIKGARELSRLEEVKKAEYCLRGVVVVVLVIIRE